MNGRWQALSLFCACVAGLSVVPAAVATEILPPSRPCVLVNEYKEIFVGRVISTQKSGRTRVQVLRSYKGIVSGEVTVSLSSTDLVTGGGTFDPGETYIFYSSGPSSDPQVGRVVTFWSTKHLSSAKPGELNLLSRINQPPHTGTIFGTLDRHFTPPGMETAAEREGTGGQRPEDLFMHDGPKGQL